MSEPLIDAEVTPYGYMAPSAQTPETQLSDIPTATMLTTAHIVWKEKPTTVADPEALNKRLVPVVSMNPFQPVYVMGRPTSPKYYAENDVSLDLHTTGQHLHLTNDPDPVWDNGTSSWLVDPPDGGVGTYRWTVRDLPPPDTIGPHGYPLGARGSADNSSGLPDNCSHWLGDDGTPGAPAWHSRYPWKPRVVSYTHRNEDGTAWHVDAGVRFNVHSANHMWTTFSAHDTTPFTWIVVAMILDNATRNYEHFLLDTGKDPETYGITGLEEASAGNYGQILSDLQESTPQRRYFMSVDRNRQYIANDRSSHRIHTHHPLHRKPRMYYGIWHHNESYVGNIGHNYHSYFKGDLTSFSQAQDNWIMGRENGWLHADHGASMLVFEMRYWDSALDRDTIKAQYKQLSTTWKFARFG